MKVLKKFNNSFLANIAKGILEEEGIQAFILNENIGYCAGMPNTDMLAIQLVVDDSDFDRAKEILASRPVGQ